MPMQQQQTPQGKSQREEELEVALENLNNKVYLANLKDDVFFRVELLSSLNNIAIVFQTFLNEIKQSQGGTQ
jgi:hypothetical protein